MGLHKYHWKFRGREVEKTIQNFLIEHNLFGCAVAPIIIPLPSGTRTISKYTTRPLAQFRLEQTGRIERVDYTQCTHALVNHQLSLAGEECGWGRGVYVRQTVVDSGAPVTSLGLVQSIHTLPRLCFCFRFLLCLAKREVCVICLITNSFLHQTTLKYKGSINFQLWKPSISADTKQSIFQLLLFFITCYFKQFISRVWNLNLFSLTKVIYNSTILKKTKLHNILK